MSANAAPGTLPLPLADLVRGATIDVPVRGGSMRPLLRDGDVVRVRPLGAGEPARGQIVLKVADGRWVLHRLLRANERRVKTRGDNRTSADAPSERVAVLGIATHVRRLGCWVPIDWPAPASSAWRRVAMALALARAWRQRRSRRNRRARGGTAA